MHIQILLLFIPWCSYATPIDPTTVSGNSEYYTISTASYVLNEVQCQTDICYVTCQTGCHSATINASLSQQLTLDCSIEESCTELQITEGPKAQTSITCGIASCQNAAFYLTTTPTIDIECNGAGTSTSGCYQLLFHAGDAHTVTINCNDNGCRDASFYVNNAYTVEINSNAVYGLYASNVFADNVENGLTVNCNLADSCSYSSVYCPSGSACDIFCPPSSSCEGLQVHVVDKTYDHLALDCDDTSSSACTGVDIICPSNAESTLIKDGTWKCDSYSCCPIRDGTTTCPSGVDCVINCDRETCTNSVIDGSDAASLTVDCYTGSSGGCAGAVIKCPTTDMGSCTVLCEETDSCSYAVIQALGSTMDVFEVHCSTVSDCDYLYMDLGFDSLNVLNLTLVSVYERISVDHSASLQQFELNCKDCSSVDLFLSDIEIASAKIICDNEDSCLSMELDLTISELLDFQCTEIDSCRGINVNAYVVGDVDISIVCHNHGDTRTSYSNYGNVYSACADANFKVSSDVDRIQTASVYCRYYDCWDAVFNFTNMTNVDVTCASSKSCRSMKLDALHAQSLDLECSSYESCYSAAIYCPHQKEGACNINCADASDSCDYIDIVVDDIYTPNYLDLTCPEGRCGYFYIECNKVQYAQKYDVQLAYLYDNRTDTTAYRCDTAKESSRYCCPSVNEMATCEDQDCYIDCSYSNCKEQTIDASNAESLTIDCPDYSCKGTTIIAPVTSCVVECGYKACQNMTIQESAHNMDLSLRCYDEYACNSMDVITPNAQYIGMNCTDDKACYYMTIEATYSQSVAIRSTGWREEEGTWSHSTLYANHAKSVSIWCASKSYDYEYACADNNYYLPDFGTNTDITCAGLGCLSLGNIFVNTSVSQLSLEICHYSYCGDGELCANAWNIQCGAGTDTFDDQTCSSSLCGCDEMVSAMSYGEVCISHAITSSKSDPVVAVIISSTVGGVVLILIIVSVWCLCCRENKGTTTKKQLENTIVSSSAQGDANGPTAGPTPKPSIQLVESNEPGATATVTQPPFTSDPAIAALPLQSEVMARSTTNAPTAQPLVSEPVIAALPLQSQVTPQAAQPTTSAPTAPPFASDPVIAALPLQSDIMVQPTASAPSAQPAAAFMNEEPPPPAYDPSFNAPVGNEREGNVTHQ